MRQVTHAALAALMVSALACRDRNRDETASRVESAATVVEQDVRQDVAEARDEVRAGAHDLKSYTWAQRDDFRSDVRQRLTAIDGQIDQLAHEASTSGSVISDRAVTDMRLSRKTLERRLAKLDDVGEDNWNGLRDGVDSRSKGSAPASPS